MLGESVLTSRRLAEVWKVRFDQKTKHVGGLQTFGESVSTTT